MTGRKKLIKIAKIMFKNSLSGGYLDNNKAKKIIAEVSSLKPTGLAKILTIYKRYLKEQLAREEIVIESATALPNKSMEKELLLKTGAKRIRYQINIQMVSGAKIKHGDWLYDESLSAKLANLTQEI
ncbi:MAG: F0F1-type ATP synthase, delta subunit [Candidatus Curtissbacteria bacterium GW2011_GWA1_40_16]|uniref:F0F1-type ATP synthase, delta subunit n=1 Tax=Candidatus Curtissbacteria bacterium GW2011_GWA1_40_16 TaxID=1618405 RepID=A0A0G0ULJ4_9BACT|nr:MAG: F0F1-type ATP synthase, delta subunit [Candidatus Curtissbacteria bacterium GW2011_GWA1_40_16]